MPTDFFPRQLKLHQTDNTCQLLGLDQHGQQLFLTFGHGWLDFDGKHKHAIARGVDKVFLTRKFLITRLQKDLLLNYLKQGNYFDWDIDVHLDELNDVDLKNFVAALVFCFRASPEVLILASELEQSIGAPAAGPLTPTGYTDQIQLLQMESNRKTRLRQEAEKQAKLKKEKDAEQEREAEKSRIQSARVQAKACVFCGKPLGFFARLTAATNHKACTEFVGPPAPDTATPQPPGLRHRGFAYNTDGLYSPLCDTQKIVRGIWFRDRDSISNQTRLKMVAAQLALIGLRVEDADYESTIMQGRGGVEELTPGAGFVLWFPSAKSFL